MLRLFLAALLALSCAQGSANPSPATVADPALEKRVTALSEELRCLVCQNQSIADSNAPLALDLKNQVREKLTQGKSEQEVIAYMVERYGDFVRYRPPLKSSTWLLWFGPVLLLLAGMLMLFRKLRAQRPADACSEPDLQRAAQLLQADLQTRQREEHQ